MPTSWHNICSAIATCKLHGLTCTGRAFGLVHTVQRAPSKTVDIGWYCFNNNMGYMTAIEKKSKLKNGSMTSFSYAGRHVGGISLIGTMRS